MASATASAELFITRSMRNLNAALISFGFRAATSDATMRFAAAKADDILWTAQVHPSGCVPDESLCDPSSFLVGSSSISGSEYPVATSTGSVVAAAQSDWFFFENRPNR